MNSAERWQMREDEKNGEALTDILCGVVAGIFFGAAIMAWFCLGLQLQGSVHL